MDNGLIYTARALLLEGRSLETSPNGRKQKIHNYAPATGLLNTSVRNGETKTYTYDASAGYPGRIKSIEITGRHKQTFSYDDLSRLTNVKEEIDGRTYNRGTEYDVFGRIKKEIYPTGYYTQNHYDANGYLIKTTDRENRNIWELKALNARGQITREKKGNKETTYSYYDNGLPELVSAPSVIDNWYQFNGRGNLTYRDEYAISNSPIEAFTYDAQNRLTSWNVNYSTAKTIVYNPTTGNIQNKSDLGAFTFAYGSNGKPHALTSISGVPAGFPADNLTVTYTDFKKIQTLSEGNKFYQLSYGVDDQRRKSVYKENNVIKKTSYYLGDYEEEIFPNGNTRKIHYLGGAVLIQNTNSSADSLLYVYTDYLGSITALTNESGTVIERYAYDPWGKRRNPNHWSQADTRTSWILNRGYTGHEHLDAFGIINMNGRVYDPLTASFFSPDPYVTYPNDWLNYNRYSYALNNPFRYTDPNGENPLFLLAYYALYQGMTYYMQGGSFWEGAVKGAITGAAGALLTYGIGEALGHTLGGLGTEVIRAGAHGLVGGGTNLVQGGSFLEGFAVGSLSSLAGSGMQSLGWDGSYLPTVTGAVGAGMAWAMGSDPMDGFWQGYNIGALNHKGEKLLGDDGKTKLILSCDDAVIIPPSYVDNGQLYAWNLARGMYLPVSGRGERGLEPVYPEFSLLLGGTKAGISAFKYLWREMTRPVISTTNTIDANNGFAVSRGSANSKKINESYLKRNGLDAHQLKQEFVGKNNISRFDLYKDSMTGEVLILRKGGTGTPIHTGKYIYVK